MSNTITVGVFGSVLGVFLATPFFFAIPAHAEPTPNRPGQYFFSEAGREHQVEFRGLYRTEENLVRALETDQLKQRFIRRDIMPTMAFLFGPLTYKSLGGPQRLQDVTVDWDDIRSLGDGKVELPYRYSGIWIVNRFVAMSGKVELPVPYNREVLYTTNWKRCTDSDPDHQTTDFYWYFWDPRRPGCEHKVGQQYQMVTAKIGRETINQERSLPEYSRVLADGKLTMTVAFGYIEDKSDPRPESDKNGGASEYREFVQAFRAKWGPQFTESKILQGEYEEAPTPEKQIGRKFEGVLNGVSVTVNVVTAAGIDQMELFAKSFAHDHDDFFGWFGHSRVGSGFDATTFGNIVAFNPSYYSITTNYQLIYWGGCNSYSYYTLPFFEFKARAGGGADPNGTRNLDIIANGLPSYFSLNAENAMIAVDSLLDWPEKPTYQSIIKKIESRAQEMGTRVLAAVLGDEDNEER